jgi:predicted amidohydrolase
MPRSKLLELTTRTTLAQGLLLAAAVLTGGAEPIRPATLTVGVVQMALELDLTANRDKMLRFVRQAHDRGCRVIVFPETALSAPPETPRADRDAAIDALRTAAANHEVYVIFCVKYRRDDKELPFERLLVIDPQGKVVHSYDKLWGDARFTHAPGLFFLDKVPCAAAICADRWIRSVEDLPAVAGAKVLFECSNNYDNEWIEDLGWYWYVPRALRNEVYVVFANTARANRAEDKTGHGHSAVIGPDGALIAKAGEESDKLILAQLDLARATGGQAKARRHHPLFKPFWELGLAILEGKRVEDVPYQPLSSPAVELKLAAAQMACARRIDDNLARMETMIGAAREKAADLIVFPELAVTGAREDDITAATPQDLARALDWLQQAAKKSQVYVVCGLPWQENNQRYNCAVVIDPRGQVLTRYAQVVVDRPKLFAPGTSTQAMWFDIQGVPAVVTIGRDALWSEIAEMAALRGAQVHVHLAYDSDTSAAGLLRRKQLWANLASFRTFTATVNAASPDDLARPSAPSGGGSALWEDFHRAKGGKVGGYAPHSAVRLAEAKQDETILYATQTVQKANPQFRVLTERTNPQMKPWYATGARVIAEAPARR